MKRGLRSTISTVTPARASNVARACLRSRHPRRERCGRWSSMLPGSWSTVPYAIKRGRGLSKGSEIVGMTRIHREDPKVAEGHTSVDAPHIDRLSFPCAPGVFLAVPVSPTSGRSDGSFRHAPGPGRVALSGAGAASSLGSWYGREGPPIDDVAGLRRPSVRELVEHWEAVRPSSRPGRSNTVTTSSTWPRLRRCRRWSHGRSSRAAQTTERT